MEKLLNSVQIAWNPILEVKKRLEAGKLDFVEVIAPFVMVIVACKLIEFEAQKYLYDSICFVYSPCPELPPFFSSEFAQGFMVAFGSIFPLGAIFLAPKSMYTPRSASCVAASVLIITTSITFYEATVTSALYVFQGTLMQSDPQAALNLSWLPLASIPLLVILAISFWWNVLVKVLDLSKSSFAVVVVSYLVGIGLLVSIINMGSSSI